MDDDTKILLQELNKIEGVASGVIYLAKKAGGSVPDGQYLRTVKDIQKLASSAMEKVEKN